MVVNCPNCGKQLKMSDKMLASIKQLDDGKKIKAKCVHCAVPFGFGANDLVEPVENSAKPKSGNHLEPPGSPDVSWLKDGVFDGQEMVEDIPRALVLMPDTPNRGTVLEAVEDFGYQAEQASSPEEAVGKMRFINYSAVFLHSKYEGGGLQASEFHSFMQAMSMSRRRFIFYVLIWEEFDKLYDLQARANSANLVINDTEIPFIVTILKKAIPEYETLFGPLMEELRIAGK
jgi:hypothetical protein